MSTPLIVAFNTFATLCTTGGIQCRVFIAFAVTPALYVWMVVISLRLEVMLVDIVSLFLAVTFCILGAMSFRNF